MKTESTVRVERDGPVMTIVIDRPQVRNAVDFATAAALATAFEAFDADPTASVAVLWGAGGHFCAGADLKAVAQGTPNRLKAHGNGPMGPSRMTLSKPVIAAIEGYAVAGGLELAAWCDLRVAAQDARLGVACRRWGVPLIDGGTIRLPRLIGHSRAMDLILTGREIDATEAERMGLVNRVVDTGSAREAAVTLAKRVASFPQHCMRADRQSAISQWALPLDTALKGEFEGGLEVILSGETLKGASRFAKGAGRHGEWDGGDQT